MRWRNIASMTVVLVFILSGPAVSQQWVDIKDPKELRTLHSNKTFKMTDDGVPVVEHYRVDGKGIVVYGEQRRPITWEIKGNDQVCVSSQAGTTCWTFQHSKKNPEEYVRRGVVSGMPYMQFFKIEDGIPQF